ncbi:cytochrome P450 [Streptomyces sp. NPDC048566]|uniref:cytochrome P450 n=1 Tax=Streptomyces sp. NPDC048566 TaxID=3365569 RepID=UPI003723D33F
MPENTTVPVRYYKELGSWVVSDKDTAQAALGQFGLSSRTADAGSYLPEDMKEQCAELLDVLSRWFVLLDGEQHTAARRGVQRMFSPGRIRKLHESIEEIVEEALDEFPQEGVGDAMPQLAGVISARTMALMLGLEKTDAAQLHGWARAIADFLAASYRRDFAVRAQDALRNMGEFVKNSDRADSIWNYTSGDERDRLATCSLMLFGGLETTAALMGFSLWYVIENGLTQLVADEAHATETAEIVERVLELHPPLGHVARTAETRVEIEGQAITPGDLVLVSLTGHDPFDPPACPVHPAPHTGGGRRTDHLAFGHGMHYCMGAPLARMEAAALLPRFARRFPDARVQDLAWSKNRTYRGFDHLNIRLSAYETE